MSDWFNDIESDDAAVDPLAMDTSNTNNDDTSFGGIADSSYGNTTTNDNSMSVGDEQPSGNAIVRFREKIGKGKFAALIAIAIGIIVIIVIVAIFGRNINMSNPNKVKDTAEQVTATTTTQQTATTNQTTTATTQQTATTQTEVATTGTSGASWSKLEDSALDLSSATIVLDDTFEIKTITLYADVKNGYALRAEATGTIVGRNNTKNYTTTIPLDAATKIMPYLKDGQTISMKVDYKTLEKNNMVFVYDITLQ